MGGGGGGGGGREEGLGGGLRLKDLEENWDIGEEERDEDDDYDLPPYPSSFPFSSFAADKSKEEQPMGQEQEQDVFSPRSPSAAAAAESNLFLLSASTRTRRASEEGGDIGHTSASPSSPPSSFPSPSSSSFSSPAAAAARLSSPLSHRDFSDMHRFFHLLLPSPSITPSSLPPSYSPAWLVLSKWIDPHGSGRVTKRLGETYPEVGRGELLCFAALCKTTGLWREALGVLDDEAGGREGRKDRSGLSRMVGKKLQEVRMSLIKKHQTLKQEQFMKEKEEEEAAVAVAAMAKKKEEEEEKEGERSEGKEEEGKEDDSTIIHGHRAAQGSDASLSTLNLSSNNSSSSSSSGSSSSRGALRLSNTGTGAPPPDAAPSLPPPFPRSPPLERTTSTGLDAPAPLSSPSFPPSLPPTGRLHFSTSSRIDLLRSESLDSDSGRVLPSTPLLLLSAPEDDALLRESEGRDSLIDSSSSTLSVSSSISTTGGINERLPSPAPLPPHLQQQQQQQQRQPSPVSPPPPPPSPFVQAVQALSARARFLLRFNPASEGEKGDEEGREEALLQACTEFLLDKKCVDVGRLHALFVRRLGRATCRRFGLRCFRALLHIGGLKGGWREGGMTSSSASSSFLTACQVYAVRHIKAALGRRMLMGGEGGRENEEEEAEEEDKSGREFASSGGDSQQQQPDMHHYLTGLEGIPLLTRAAVQDDFFQLYAHLLLLLKRALAQKDVALACHVLEAWALDFLPADASFLRSTKILNSLRSLLSLHRLSHCLAAGNVLKEGGREGGRGGSWSVWPVEDVRAGLAHGKLTKRLVLEHMCSVPLAFVPSSWGAPRGLLLQLQSPPSSLPPSSASSSPPLLTTHHIHPPSLLSWPFSFSEIEYLSLHLTLPQLLLAYDALHRHLSALRTSLRLSASRDDEAGREKHRRDRGVRYTYVVTATNGVGVRERPDTRSERTGHSFKQLEVVEASYRLSLSGGQTYLKLVGGGGGAGWVFDVGVRGTYKEKQIMKCIATERYVEEEEEPKEALRLATGAVLVPVLLRSHQREEGEEEEEEEVTLLPPPVEIPPSQPLTAYYKNLSGEHWGLVKSSIRMPLKEEEGGRQSRREGEVSVSVTVEEGGKGRKRR